MDKQLLYTRQEPCPQRIHQQFNTCGIQLIEIPLIQVEKIQVGFPKEKNDWLFFTSANAVHFFDFSKIDPATKIAAIGDRTQQALMDYKLKVDFVPSSFYTEIFLQEWLAMYPDKKQKILVPISCQSRHLIKAVLTEKGYEVNELPLYQTIFPEASKMKVRNFFKHAFPLDCALFASPSAWKNFYHELKENMHNYSNLKIASIGPITTKAIEQDHFQVSYQPDTYNMSALFSLLLKEMS